MKINKKPLTLWKAVTVVIIVATFFKKNKAPGI